ADVAPAGGDVGGQDPVVGLGQRGVLGLRVAVELRAGGLEHGQPGETGDHPLLVAVLGDHGVAYLAAVADEGVVVRAGRGGDPLPGVLLDLLAGAVDVVVLVHEVPGHLQREVLDGADAAPLLGLGVDRVLLGVGGQALGVVALGVHRLQVTAELGGVVDVLDAVHGGAAVDVHHAHLGLAVLVVSESDPHGSSPSCASRSGFAAPAAVRVRAGRARGGSQKGPARPGRPGAPSRGRAACDEG